MASSTHKGWRLNEDRTRLDAVFNDTVLFSLNGTGLSLFNATPAVQQTALTAQHATMTQAGTDSGDVAIQALVQNTGFGFVLAAEGEAVVASVLNLMVRVQELEDKLQALGLLA